MNKTVLFSALMAALALVSCTKEDNNNDYKGSNYVYLSSDNTTIYQSTDNVIDVSVDLTKSIDKDVDLTFVVSGKEGLVTLEGNPVHIPAGTKSASLTIAVDKSAELISEAAVLNLNLAETAQNGDLVLKAPFTFSVVPMSAESLNDNQKALLANYKAKTNIDLSPYVGLVKVKTTILTIDYASEEPIKKDFEGYSVITINEEASVNDSLSLDMTTNPMGIQDYAHKVYRSLTIENDEFWFDQYSSPSYKTLVDKLNWTRNSEEVFSMSLKNVNFHADGKTINYTHTFIDEPEPGEDPDMVDDPITKVPFEFGYTAWDREQALIASGEFNPSADPEWAYDATSNPNAFINTSNISVDDFEAQNGHWIYPCKAELTAEGLQFTFCMLMGTNDSDYTKVIATYIPNIN